MKFIKDIIGEQRERLHSADQPSRDWEPATTDRPLQLGSQDRVDTPSPVPTITQPQEHQAEEHQAAIDRIMSLATGAPPDTSLSDEDLLPFSPQTTDHVAQSPVAQAMSDAQDTSGETPRDAPLFSGRRSPPLSGAPEDETHALSSARDPIQVPEPALGRAGGGISSRSTGRSAGRVKTRLLGFNPATSLDPFAADADGPSSPDLRFPVGWLALIKGPGRGACFTLQTGVNTLGRGADQTVQLDFGDNSISRAQHAAIAYDPEQKAFFVGHGGKANLVRLNDRPVLSTEPLRANDQLRIGETTLRFVPLCDDTFTWDDTAEATPHYVT